MPNLSKKRANIIHFKRRLIERYGIDMSGNEIDKLSSFIRDNGKIYFIKKLTRSRSLFKIPIQNQEVLVIYDKNQHSLLTALPKMQSLSEDKWKKDISEKFNSIITGARILEIGSALSSSRPFFLQCSEYLGLDVAPGGGVNIVSIAHEYDAPDNSFDVVCSFSQLEHDMYWRKTLRKMVKLTKPGGLILFSCTFNWPEHGTNKTSPGQSFTNQISEEWGKYYENRSPQDIKKIWKLDKLFSDYFIGLNPYDDGFTVFWGIKK